MKKLIALLFGKTLVVLEDFQGKEYLVFERISYKGQKYSYVYDFAKVGHVNLLDNGQCSGESCYITSWSYYK